MIRFVLIAVLCGLIAPHAWAQDLRRLEPEPVPPVPAPPRAEPESAPTAPESDERLLPRLEGLVFLSHPEQLTEPAELDETRLDVRRVEMLQAADFAQRMQRWLGQPLSRRDLQRLLTAINLYYAAHERPFVSVSIPSQDVTDGILRVLVVEAYLSEVQVSGNRWFGERYYREAFGLRPGDRLRKSEIAAGIEWLGRSNPFHAATVVASPGDDFATTELELLVNEQRPWRVYAGANNTGTETTDTERLVFGGNWGNVFGLGHQINAQLTTSPDFDRSVGLSANYTAPLPWRHLLHVSAAWSRINADVPAPFDSEGESWQILGDYEIPLAPLGGLRHALHLGVDFKRSDNSLEFGGFPVTDNTTDVVQTSLGWQGSLPDRYGQTRLDARLVHAPGDITGRNEDEHFVDSRWGASADYTYGRLSLHRHTRLPLGLAWRLTAAWQQSDTNLLGSEQLALSGTYGVRGYHENDLYADEGLLLRNELLLPPVHVLGQPEGDGRGMDHLQLLLFADYGRGNSQDRLPGELDHVSISSVGVGARYTLGRHLSAGIEYGWQQKALPGEDTDDRAHVMLMLAY